MSAQDLLLYGSLLLFVGGPTTIGAAIAVRIAIRGGVSIARALAVASASGAIATTAAFVYMTAQGGGDGLPGFPEVPPEALAVETLQLTFEDADNSFIFILNDMRFSTERTERLVIEAARIGTVKEITIIDTVRHSGGEVLKVRDVAQTFGLGFTIVEGDIEQQ